MSRPARATTRCAVAAARVLGLAVQSFAMAPRAGAQAQPVPEPSSSDWAADSSASLALSAGVRGWPTPAGAARGVVLGAQAHYNAAWWRVRAAAAVTDRPTLGRGPGLLDGRAVVATAPLRVGPLGTDASAGVERDAYDPRGTWAQRGAQLRVWAGAPTHGVWVGAGVTAPGDRRTTPRATEWAAGAWTVRGAAELSATVRGVVTSRLDPIQAVYADTLQAVPGACYVAYDAARQLQQAYTVCPHRLGAADAVLGLRWGWRGAAFQVHAGRRLAAQLPSSPPGGGLVSWAGAGATLPPLGPVALALSYRRQPQDVVRGIPATARFFAGLRWVPAGHPAEPLPPRTAVRASADAAVGVRTLAFALGTAGAAEVRGDFTGWCAAPLRRAADGGWEGQFVLPPGLHTLAVRTDGGPWEVPPGLASADDGFGGTVGLLIIDDRPSLSSRSGER